MNSPTVRQSVITRTYSAILLLYHAFHFVIFQTLTKDISGHCIVFVSRLMENCMHRVAKMVQWGYGKQTLEKVTVCGGALKISSKRITNRCLFRRPLQLFNLFRLPLICDGVPSADAWIVLIAFNWDRILSVERVSHLVLMLDLSKKSTRTLYWRLSKESNYHREDSHYKNFVFVESLHRMCLWIMHYI